MTTDNTNSFLTSDQLSPSQSAAVQACIDTANRIVCVSGEAGTGKTTIIRVAAELLTKAGHSIIAAAPTGKAARRIQEATGIPALTLHKLLDYTHPGEINPTTGEPETRTYPRKNKGNRLEYSVIFVDEYSMVNSQLHRELLDAVSPQAVIRVLGDLNQLRPIEEDKRVDKSPFQTLCANKSFKCIELSENFRQASGSSIITNLHQIRLGKMPKPSDDFVIRFTATPVKTLEEILFGEFDGDDNPFATLDAQVITTQHSTWVGTTLLNASISRAFQDSNAKTLTLERNKWTKQPPLKVFVGAKVICTANMYDIGVYNGEQGIITDIFMDEMVVDFGDRMVQVPPRTEYEDYQGKEIKYSYPQRNFDLAYAITTHKAQGSEWDKVVYVINASTSYSQSRQNLYTAMSRARTKATLITDRASLTRSLNFVEGMSR